MTDATSATAQRRATSSATSAPLAAASIVRKRSRIHGSGVFARRPIAKGTRVVEYTGERITHAEADRRYEDRAYEDNHTFLFMVDDKLVVDGGVGGSVARFINHSCDGNCEIEIDRRRIFIEAIRAITPGEELTYDYSLVRTPEDPPDVDEVFACRCGAATCRGSMMAAKKPAVSKKAASKKAASKKPVRKPAARAGTKKPATKKLATKKAPSKKATKP